MIYLCDLTELPDGETRGFTIAGRLERFEVFAFRRGMEVAVWRNACPHLGISLEWQPNQFLSAEKDFYLCATHGALFRLDDGYCVSGPCRGQRLGRVASEIRDAALWVDVPVGD